LDANLTYFCLALQEETCSRDEFSIQPRRKLSKLGFVHQPQFITTYAHGFPTIQRVTRTLRGLFDRTPPQVVVVQSDDGYPYPYYDGYGYGGGAYPVFVGGGRRGGRPRGGGGHGGGGGGHHRGIGHLGGDDTATDTAATGAAGDVAGAAASAAGGAAGFPFAGITAGTAATAEGQEEAGVGTGLFAGSSGTPVFNVPQGSTSGGPSWLPGVVQGGTSALLSAFGLGGPSAPKAAPSSGSFLTSTPVLIGGAVLVGLFLLRRKKSVA
jgi:hypothetical protein